MSNYFNEAFAGLCITQINDVNLYIVFYNGVCKKTYARNEKEEIELIEETEGK